MLQTDLHAIERDIKFLEDLALVLRENIQVLKSDKIIAVASEYKKAVEELATVNKNLGYYTSMYSKLTKDFDKYVKIRDNSIFEYENLKQQIDGRKVILLFDPSKRKT
jgi:hypothetical protein